MFCTYVSICSLHISEKCFRLKCFFFIRLSVLACFPTFIETYKMAFLSDLDCDSHVIIETGLPSLESSDAV